MFHKIKNQRQHLESCLNTRGIESKMLISSTSTTTHRGFNKKVSAFIEPKIGGTKIKVYVKQTLKNSLSRRNVERLCKRIVTRKLVKHLGLAGFSSIIIIFFLPRTSQAVDMSDVPLPFPPGLDEVTGRPIMTSSGVSCEQVGKSWYRACCSYKNLYGRPSPARQLNCAAHTVLACGVTAGFGIKIAGDCMRQKDWTWTGASLTAGGAALMVASQRSQEAYMFMTMQDWCDCGMGEEKGIICPTSQAAARAYLGSPSFWEETKMWFGHMKANKGFTDLSDGSLKLAEDILKGAAANGTLPVNF
jgi:hypothetical protein